MKRNEEFGLQIKWEIMRKGENEKYLTKPLFVTKEMWDLMRNGKKKKKKNDWFVYILLIMPRLPIKIKKIQIKSLSYPYLIWFAFLPIQTW